MSIKSQIAYSFLRTAQERVGVYPVGATHINGRNVSYDGSKKRIDMLRLKNTEKAGRNLAIFLLEGPGKNYKGKKGSYRQLLDVSSYFQNDYSEVNERLSRGLVPFMFEWPNLFSEGKNGEMMGTLGYDWPVDDIPNKVTLILRALEAYDFIKNEYLPHSHTTSGEREKAKKFMEGTEIGLKILIAQANDMWGEDNFEKVYENIINAKKKNANMAFETSYYNFYPWPDESQKFMTPEKEAGILLHNIEMARQNKKEIPGWVSQMEKYLKHRGLESNPRAYEREPKKEIILLHVPHPEIYNSFLGGMEKAAKSKGVGGLGIS
ncbi:MAG: hypothetical protein GXO64_00310 [Candidatus Micrarchaeota archaeon]|nr:hypothetical protein [Candidatus Micrarchaeota archaeon]